MYSTFKCCLSSLQLTEQKSDPFQTWVKIALQQYKHLGGLTVERLGLQRKVILKCNWTKWGCVQSVTDACRMACPIQLSRNQSMQ